MTHSVASFEDAIIGLINYPSTIVDTIPLDSYIKIVNDPSYDWLMEDSLYAVALRLLALYEYDKNCVSGTMLASLTNRLLNAEVVPGGPYVNTGDTPDITTNAAIAQLFISLGTPLPKVQSYLQAECRFLKNIYALSHAWILVWPYSTATYPPEVMSYIAKIAPFTRAQRFPGSASMTVPALRSLPLPALAVRGDIQQLPLLLQQSAIKLWESIVAADTHFEIALLSSYFTSSLRVTPNFHADTKLDEANIYAWMAYTKYDDFIDDEGDPFMLPLANIFHRKSLMLLTAQAQSASMKDSIRKQFDGMDAANYWELSECRFKINGTSIAIDRLARYGNRHVLAKRAGVHGLGPLVILTNELNHSRTSIRHFQKFTQEYLIARQLNDDLHDWKDDLRHGHSSYVVTFLLRKTRIKPGLYSLDQLIDTLQIYFWKAGLEILHNTVLTHAKHALDAADKSQLFKKNSLFIAMTVQPIIDSVIAAQNTLNHKKTFLEPYRLDE